MYKYIFKYKTWYRQYIYMYLDLSVCLVLVSIRRCVFSQLSVSECNQTLATEVMCSALQTDLRLLSGAQRKLLPFTDREI